MGWKKWFRRILLTLVVLVVTVFAAGAALLYFYGDEVKAFAIKEINKRLAVKISVTNTELVFWETFPDVSLKFSNLIVSESTPITGRALATAKSAFVSFDIWDIISKKYSIRKFHLDDATVNMAIGKNGDNNFSITKPSDKKDTSAASPFDLKKVSLHDVRFLFSDVPGKSVYRFVIYDMAAKGSFGDEQFTLDASVQSKATNLTIGGTKYLNSQLLNLETRLDVNSKAGSWKIANSTLSLNSSQFEITGAIAVPEGKPTFLNLDIRGKKTSLGQLIDLVPGDAMDEYKKYESSGDIAFHTSVKGNVSREETPAIKAEFSVNNASMKPPGLNTKLEKISFSGKFVNASAAANKQQLLELDNLSFSLENQQLQGKLYLLGNEDPTVNTALNGSINLQKLGEFLSLKDLEMGGEARCDAKLQAKLSSLKNKDAFGSVNSEGFIRLENVLLKTPGSSFEYKNLNGELRLLRGDLAVDHLSGSLSGNPFSFNGHFLNLPSLFGLNEDKFIADGNLHFSKLNATALFAESQKSDASAKPVEYRFPSFMDMRTRLRIDDFVYRKFTAAALDADLEMISRSLNIKTVNCRALNGTLSLSGKITQQDKGFNSTLSFKGNGIDISRAFTEFEEFGQQTITHANLKGALTTTVNIGCNWTRELKIVEKSIHGFIDFQLNNGELNQFEPLMKLSKFIKVSELENVKFDPVQTTIDIVNEQIVIPQTKLGNSALDLYMGGTHGFNNTLDYSIVVRIADILASKIGFRKKHSAEEFEDLGDGKGLKIYITMQGTPDNLTIKLDQFTVKKKIAEGVKSEKGEFRDAIRSEFGKKDAKKGEPKKEEPAENPDWIEE